MMPKLTKAEYFRLKEQGMKDAAIARKIGISRQAVHYMGQRYGLPSGTKINRIEPGINEDDDGLLHYARSLKAARRLDSKIAAVFIYYSVVRSIITHLLSALRHLSSVSTLRKSSGKITVNVPKNDSPGNVFGQIGTLELFDFPEKKLLLDLLESFLKRLIRLRTIASEKSTKEIIEVFDQDLDRYFDEAEEIIKKYHTLLVLLRDIFETT